ncbi:MAG: hypothetical protein WCH84_04225 [Verrucomicrobiota bacterium]
MIIRLYGYFGVIGLASIIAWCGALALLATQAVLGVFAPHRQRPRAYLIMLGLAITGYILAQINSNRVSSVPLDSGGQPVIQQSVEELQSEAGVPAYRQIGKQRREGGSAAPIVPVEQKPALSYREAQLLEANQLDRWNLLITRGTLLLALLALVADYLARFNRTTGHSYPLPIAGPWLDRLVPKLHTLLTGDLDLKGYLETVVRRGETFLFFTATDPWAASTLPRLGKFYQLAKLTYGQPADCEFYFNAVWFNRYCVVVPTDAALLVLPQLQLFLEWHTFTKAAARQTVHVVWDLPAPPPEQLLQNLIALGCETNFKIILKPMPINSDAFEEIHV